MDKKVEVLYRIMSFCSLSEIQEVTKRTLSFKLSGRGSLKIELSVSTPKTETL
jgi:hypothetical protein